MVKRVVIGTLLTAPIMFVWGALYWMVLPLPFDVLRPLSTDRQIRLGEQLNEQLTRDGVYSLPIPEEGVDKPDDVNSPFMQRHRSGPLVFIAYRRAGLPPMAGSVFALGFLHDLVCAAFMAGMLAFLAPILCCYGSRVALTTSLGVFAALWTEGLSWIWMHFPLDYQVFNGVYHATTWLVAGLVLGAIVKRSECATQKTGVATGIGMP